MITLATLPQASAQEVFDQVVNHLLTQMERSVLDGTGDDCLYHSGHLKCAAGCLIADDEYDKRMEGTNWSGLHEDDYVPGEHAGIIERLQSVHDFRRPYEWEAELKQLAEEVGLAFNWAPAAG